ncbi:hypothetical protein B0I35DRAFT_506904 [Stachybotrys elegans]|uniref:Protein FAF1 n=1 Tax=Stachybotrys elegans TaxID=80388 RepID=A0A8K0WW92_9HYPO|nr:hypothetical protein B0I35DRAFT_506904 [Stachybotrys elegans]
MGVLGKRKASGPSVDEQEAQEIFRRHFEAQFKPLPTAEAESQAAQDESDAEQSDDESEWGGFSEEEEEEEEEEDGDEDAQESTAVQVVDHSSSASQPTVMSKREQRAFMSSRPPDSSDTPREKPAATARASSSTLPEDAPSLLAQDLELRRLLSESHLLARKINNSPFATQGTNEPRPFAAGRIRQKANDMRVQALGSKVSILKQENVPMNLRKIMVNAATSRENKRRREARENGVILERSAGKKKTRDRRGGGPAVDRPAIGRMRGAELRISEKDIKGIEGSRDTFGRRGKR